MGCRCFEYFLVDVDNVVVFLVIWIIRISYLKVDVLDYGVVEVFWVCLGFFGGKGFVVVVVDLLVILCDLFYYCVGKVLGSEVFLIDELLNFVEWYDVFKVGVRGWVVFVSEGI